jgi:hypothetical protein
MYRVIRKKKKKKKLSKLLYYDFTKCTGLKYILVVSETVSIALLNPSQHSNFAAKKDATIMIYFGPDTTKDTPKHTYFTQKHILPPF